MLSKSPFYERISYEELRSATCEFSSSNLIGSGNFSSVFKGLLGPESKVAAVKVLNLQKHGAAKSFMAECEALKSIRHRNLVKLVTACSSIDFKGNEFKALVYEFMPNGNLDTWLHPEEVGSSENHPRPLKLCERLNIAIDVASVLDYIHSHCHDPVAHCDLKPSNVLLDNDLTAHVSDFGLARILDQESFINQLSSTGVRGTIGYAAPGKSTVVMKLCFLQFLISFSFLLIIVQNMEWEENHPDREMCTASEFLCWRCSLESVQLINSLSEI